MENYLIDDPPLTTDVESTDIQKYVCLSFIEQPNNLKNYLINSINSMYKNVSNPIIKEISNDLIKKICSIFLKKIQNKIKNCKNTIEINTNNEQLVNKYSIMLDVYNKFLDNNNEYLDFNFYNNYNIRYFDYSDDDLDYKFECYRCDNRKELNEIYIKNYGKKINERCVKVRSVHQNADTARNSISHLKEICTNKYVVPVGKWIPWHSPTINSNHYSWNDNYITVANNLMSTYISKINERDREFEEHKNNMIKEKLE